MPLRDLLKNITKEIDQIKVFELEFIYDSSCMLCIGINDFKRFLHPNHSDLRKTGRMIFNGDYFSNATAFIA